MKKTNHNYLISGSPWRSCIRKIHLESKDQIAAFRYWKQNIDKFYQWFVGFSEAESCFKVKSKYRNGKLHSFSFEYEIHLHIDDLNLLKFICEILSVGRVYARESSKSCSFVVGNEEGIRSLMKIFDRYTFNGIKLLDYTDFKEAFLSYFNRPGRLDEDLIDKLLKLKENMNTGRVEFNFPKGHQIKITKYWLLGLIEGEGTFSLAKEKLRPNFQLLFTAAQKPLLIEIRKYLISNLGFDRFSLWKLNNSSLIGIFEMKAKGKSKPTVSLEIRSVSLLRNYILPFLNTMLFISKKGHNYADFLIICNVLYAGGHNEDRIRDLILKLLSGMNDFRLSTYKSGSSSNQALTSAELTLLKKVGMRRDLLPKLSLDLLDEDNYSSSHRLAESTHKILERESFNVVYLIIKSDVWTYCGKLKRSCSHSRYKKW